MKKASSSSSSSSQQQRSSTRVVKLSKAFRTLDEESRREIVEQRLNTLEADNYNEKQEIGITNADDSDVIRCVLLVCDNFVCYRMILPHRKERKLEPIKMFEPNGLLLFFLCSLPLLASLG
jgi:hypothetical protein